MSGCSGFKISEDLKKLFNKKYKTNLNFIVHEKEEGGTEVSFNIPEKLGEKMHLLTLVIKV